MKIVRDIVAIVVAAVKVPCDSLQYFGIRFITVYVGYFVSRAKQIGLIVRLRLICSFSMENETGILQSNIWSRLKIHIRRAEQALKLHLKLSRPWLHYKHLPMSEPDGDTARKHP